MNLNPCFPCYSPLPAGMVFVADMNGCVRFCAPPCVPSITPCRRSVSFDASRGQPVCCCCQRPFRNQTYGPVRPTVETVQKTASRTRSVAPTIYSGTTLRPTTQSRTKSRTDKTYSSEAPKTSSSFTFGKHTAGKTIPKVPETQKTVFSKSPKQHSVPSTQSLRSHHSVKKSKSAAKAASSKRILKEKMKSFEK